MTVLFFNLPVSSNNCPEALDSSRYIGVIFFDLKKAFDRVWHTGLIAKLCAVRASGPALAWLTNYLSNRPQRTLVEGAVSSKVTLHAGVPQGAILSALLFNIYVNDLVSCSTADVNLFADDIFFHRRPFPKQLSSTPSRCCRFIVNMVR